MKRLIALAAGALLSGAAQAQFFEGLPAYTEYKWKDTAQYQSMQIAVIPIGEDHQDLPYGRYDPSFFMESMTITWGADWRGQRTEIIDRSQWNYNWTEGSVYEFGPAKLKMRIFKEEADCPTGQGPGCSAMWPVISRQVGNAGFFFKGAPAYFSQAEAPRRNTFRAYVTGEHVEGTKGNLRELVDHYDGGMKIQGTLVGTNGQPSDDNWRIYRKGNSGPLFALSTEFGELKLSGGKPRDYQHAKYLYDDWQSADGRLRIVNFKDWRKTVARYCPAGSYECIHLVGQAVDGPPGPKPAPAQTAGKCGSPGCVISKTLDKFNPF